MINEIEFNKASTTFHIYDLDSDMPEVISMFDDADKFNADDKLPGFTDLSNNGNELKGQYLLLEPFEVEHYKDGMTVSDVFYRLKSCEFIANDKLLFAWGDSAAVKLMTGTMALNKVEFETDDLYRLQASMTKVKSITLKNPKESELRTVKLTGCIDCYTEYNVADKNNHDITNVSGVLDSSIGALNVTASNKGGLRIGAKAGFILDFSTLLWTIGIIYGK